MAGQAKITGDSRVDSVNDRRAQMYPILSDVQIDELRRFGQEREFVQGQVLWDVGDRRVAFYVVLEEVGS